MKGRCKLWSLTNRYTAKTNTQHNIYTHITTYFSSCLCTD